MPIPQTDLGIVRIFPLVLLVARSKLIPDFALTILFLHLVITIVYTKSLPTNLLWWGLQGASAALVTSLGVWACRYRELKPISFGTGGSARKTVANGTVETDDHVRGSSDRGKNFDTGPSYEMVGMKRNDDAV